MWSRIFFLHWSFTVVIRCIVCSFRNTLMWWLQDRKQIRAPPSGLLGNIDLNFDLSAHLQASQHRAPSGLEISKSPALSSFASMGGHIYWPSVLLQQNKSGKCYVLYNVYWFSLSRKQGFGRSLGNSYDLGMEGARQLPGIITQT